MQIPIVSGIYADNSAGLRISYPVNYIAVPKQSGVSSEYLRPAYGVKQFATGTGKDRGAINWNGILYRVIGNQLVKIDSTGSIVQLGEIEGSDYVTFDYSFDRLSISGGNKLYYYDGKSLTNVIDNDIGKVFDHCWVDGYFMTTDGQYLIVTELNDPTQINPLKYGASEADPDPIKRVLKIRNEPHAVNRYTTEVFDNVGGSLFPFQRIEGAQIQKGCVGHKSACVYNDMLALLGGGRNEQPGVWVCANSQATKISTDEIDQIINSYTEAQLSESLLESFNFNGHSFLLVHLPDFTLSYDSEASKALQRSVWSVLHSGLGKHESYRAKNLAWAYDKWICGDSAGNVGYLTLSESHHFGDIVDLEFSIPIVYNQSKGAIFHQLELIALTGNVAINKNPSISTEYSIDGKTWSNKRFKYAGKIGQNKRIAWLQNGYMRNMRMQRFITNSDCHVSFLTLEANIEPLG